MNIEHVFASIRVDESSCSDRALTNARAGVGRLQSWLSARDAALCSEQDRRERQAPTARPAPCADGDSEPTDPPSPPGPQPEPAPQPSARERRRRQRLARCLEKLRLLAAALAEGRITPEHALALADLHREMARPVEAAEAELVALALGATVDDFRNELRTWKVIQSRDDGRSALDRKRAKRRLSFFDTRDGLAGVFAQFDELWGAEVRRAIELQADRLWRIEQGLDIDAEVTVPHSKRERLYADALLEMARSATGSSGPPGTSRAQPHTSVVVVVSLERLIDGLDRAGLCELADGTPIPVTEARRLAAQAGIIPMVLDSDGTVLDMGRHRRCATDEQRLALLVRDGPCADPDCDQSSVSFTHAHHVTPWGDDGTTDLANLLNQCGDDHHKIHDRGWSIATGEDGQWWLHRPDGTPHRPLKRRRPPPRE